MRLVNAVVPGFDAPLRVPSAIGRASCVLPELSSLLPKPELGFWGESDEAGPVSMAVTSVSFHTCYLTS